LTSVSGYVNFMSSTLR